MLFAHICLTPVCIVRASWSCSVYRQVYGTLLALGVELCTWLHTWVPSHHACESHNLNPIPEPFVTLLSTPLYCLCVADTAGRLLMDGDKLLPFNQQPGSNNPKHTMNNRGQREPMTRLRCGYSSRSRSRDSIGTRCCYHSIVIAAAAATVYVMCASTCGGESRVGYASA